VVGGRRVFPALRAAPTPLRCTKAFVPHEVGEGPYRRSLRRREVGGKRSETGLPGPRAAPYPPDGGSLPPSLRSGGQRGGLGPCRRSLRRREVGKRSETGLPGPRAAPFRPRFAPGDKDSQIPGQGSRGQLAFLFSTERRPPHDQLAHCHGCLLRHRPRRLTESEDPSPAHTCAPHLGSSSDAPCPRRNTSWCTRHIAR